MGREASATPPPDCVCPEQAGSWWCHLPRWRPRERHGWRMKWHLWLFCGTGSVGGSCGSFRTWEEGEIAMQTQTPQPDCRRRDKGLCCQEPREGCASRRKGHDHSEGGAGRAWRADSVFGQRSGTAGPGRSCAGACGEAS